MFYFEITALFQNQGQLRKATGCTRDEYKITLGGTNLLSIVSAAAQEASFVTFHIEGQNKFI